MQHALRNISGYTDGALSQIIGGMLYCTVSKPADGLATPGNSGPSPTNCGDFLFLTPSDGCFY